MTDEPIARVRITSPRTQAARSRRRRSNAAEIQPTASTTSQPTRNTATPAIPNVMIRSWRRGSVRVATATLAGAAGVTRSLRSVAITCGPAMRGGMPVSGASTSITRATNGMLP